MKEQMQKEEKKDWKAPEIFEYQIEDAEGLGTTGFDDLVVGS